MSKYNTEGDCHGKHARKSNHVKGLPAKFVNQQQADASEDNVDDSNVHRRKRTILYACIVEKILLWTKFLIMETQSAIFSPKPVE